MEPVDVWIVPLERTDDEIEAMLATLSPEEVGEWADITVVGEAYFTWPKIIEDIAHDRAEKVYVDESWAKEHHQIWYEEIKSGRRAPASGPVPAAALRMREEG